jgi:hypothetical protein
MLSIFDANLPNPASITATPGREARKRHPRQPGPLGGKAFSSSCFGNLGIPVALFRFGKTNCQLHQEEYPV